ncbi:MAG: hypothetical protein R2792_06595 [Saprospiraceae bacterium]
MKEERAPQTSPSGAKRLSSNTTLMWRVFAPVFGTVFLLGFTLAFWLIPEEDLLSFRSFQYILSVPSQLFCCSFGCGSFGANCCR